MFHDKQTFCHRVTPIREGEGRKLEIVAQTMLENRELV